jgi:hypothetical protein
MRSDFLKSSFALAAVCVLLAGCGGARGVLPNTMAPAESSSGARLVLSGTMSAGSGPMLLAHVRRMAMISRHPLATFNHILVQGTLFPGDAAAKPITNSISIPVPSGAFSASVPFSNVPIHSNEWGMLQFIGVAADGSQIALGELAGLINVTSASTNSATLTETTSQTFQVFVALLNNGVLSTNDLDTSTTLNSTLATKIAATGLVPDPTTHAFTTGQLLTLYNTIAPSFERNVTITASPATNGSYVLLRDYTNASELDLVNNVTQFFTTFTLAAQPPKVGTALGGSVLSCGDFEASLPIHSPSTNPVPVPIQVSSCVLPGIGAETARNVYGGHLLIGATNNQFSLFAPATPPFNGGFTAFAGHAPGTFSVSVTTAAKQQLIAVTDPAGFAFGAAFYANQPPFFSAFSLVQNFGNAPLSATTFSSSALQPFRVAVPTPYSSTSNKLTVDTFSLWDVATTNTQICGGLSCFALSATQPLVIQRAFADAGTKLTFFNWKTSGTATAITQVSGGGYKITVSGPGTATITTTVASALTPRQRVVISGSTIFPPSTWTVTAKDAAANTYADSAAAGAGSVTIEMDSVGNQVTTTQIAISFTTLAPGSMTISTITAQ